jgi:uncharacterized repeat protein (TIGR01451 family)
MNRGPWYARTVCIVVFFSIVGVRSALAGPTLTTIAVDGGTADWTTVLANPDNIVLDGPGGGLADADAPGAGKIDIDKIAYTWDATYLYFYIHRQTSSGEFNFFWFHFDVDNDGLVPDNAPLLSVSWWGTNRKVTTALDAYRAANVAAGDRIASAAGLHDGYRLPGTRAAGTALETLNGGSASGLEVEARIPWTALGVAPGTAFQFHVSSTRRVNDYPGAIADNAGRSVVFPGVDLSPDRAAATLPGTLLVLAHNVRNIGGVADTYDLSWTATGGFSPTLLNFYLDADASGTLTPGDTALADTNGNGPSDTGAMPAGGGPRAILAVASIPYTAVKGQVSTIVLRARSSVDPTVSDTAIDTVTINQPAITLLKSVDRPSAPPGGVLTYSIVYTNTGDADALSLDVVDPVPSFTSYVAGSAAGTGTTVLFSHDGGATWDASDTLPVTHVRWQRAAGLAPGANGSVTFQVAVN